MRMAFNALAGNEDDHARNHAVIWEQGGWRLSLCTMCFQYLAKALRKHFQCRLASTGQGFPEPTCLANIGILRLAKKKLLPSWI